MMAKWLADILGVTSTIYAFIVNIDNIKSAIIFLISLAYLCFRLYFMVVRSKQVTREKEIDIEKKQLELMKLRRDMNI